MQRSKHTKRDAYLAKEAFMKEAMARHLAAAERVFKPAGDGETGDADGEADVSAPAAVATGASAPAPSDEAKAKAKAVKLRAKMGTTGAPMQGAMRYEGKAGRRKGDGGDAAGDTKIGHLAEAPQGRRDRFRVSGGHQRETPKVRAREDDGGEEAQEEQTQKREGDTHGRVGTRRAREDRAFPLPNSSVQCLRNRSASRPRRTPSPPA